MTAKNAEESAPNVKARWIRPVPHTCRGDMRPSASFEMMFQIGGVPEMWKTEPAGC